MAPSLAVSRRMYDPSAEAVAEVDATAGLTKVTLPGPAADQPSWSGLGRPSSVALALRAKDCPTLAFTADPPRMMTGPTFEGAPVARSWISESDRTRL